MSGTGRIIYRSANHPDFDPKGDEAAQTMQLIDPLPKSTHGLGDWVYRWAHPLGCWLDRHTKGWGRIETKLCGCLACSGRRARWNARLPDVRRWKGGWQIACTAVAKALLRSFLALVDRLV